MKKHMNKEQRKAHYDAVDNNDKIIINFRDINHTMHCLYEGRGSQKRILIFLLELGTITQQKLTEYLGIKPGSASEVLAKLEKNNLIVRTENTADRRTTDITLTEQGRIMAEQAAMQRKTRHQDMFSCLSAEEKTTLLALLEKINASWEVRYQCEEEHPHGRHPMHEHGRHPEHEHGRHSEHEHDWHPEHEHGGYSEHPHEHEHGEGRRECDHNCQECEHPCRRGAHHRNPDLEAHYDENEG